ncbi:MAG: hypothetical protein R2713_16880 [Ilumatobacteraceae bacterium]
MPVPSAAPPSPLRRARRHRHRRHAPGHRAVAPVDPARAWRRRRRRGLARLAAGASSIVNAVNPPYHRWATDWPPLHHGFTTAAERSGAPCS